MHTIFISYNHQDAGFTERLASDLQQSGLSIWIDDLGMSFGSNWGNAVGDGLEKCDSMILVVSKPSMASKNVTDEWNYFHDKNKTIIPVLIENVARPFQLQRLKYVDFVGQPYNKAFDSLKAQLLQQPVTSKPRSSQLTMLLKPVLLGELIMALLRRLNEPW